MKQHQRFEQMADILHWLTEHRADNPGLAQIAGQFGLSEFHLQRTFQEFVGVSPKQFLKFLTKEYAKQRLRAGQNVLETSLDVGLSSPGRLHDLMVSTEALTPGEARRQGADLTIGTGFGPTPFGEALVGWTERGLCFLGFCRVKGRGHAEAELRSQWPRARWLADDQAADRWLQRIFARFDDQPVRVWLRGSPFQIKVWEALIRIPAGSSCTYGQIARHVGKKGAARAVGSAVGNNPISWLIPCHRVITSMATPGGYRWGIPTKLAMIGLEGTRATV